MTFLQFDLSKYMDIKVIGEIKFTKLATVTKCVV